jgi:histidinol dehydrogenase
MIVIRFPSRNTWPDIVKRPAQSNASLEEKIKPIIEEIRRNGDKALKRYTLEFDKVELNAIWATDYEMSSSLNALKPELLEAIRLAAANITAFHKAQLQPIEKIETMPGVVCWRKSVGIERVGLYIPGGTAPLFSTVLMLAIPAIIAGCKEIVICTPPGKNGEVHPAILASAAYLGLRRIYKVGGVQAIAAMALGTDTIPRVSKIFGPGNQYVTAAKQLIQKEGVAIDMPAGPSEVAVFADASADAAFVAADLLSQAEHGEDSQVIVVTDHEPLIESVQKELTAQLELLPRKEFAAKALGNSKIILVNNSDEGMELLNAYAPEHLILACENAEKLAEKVINAGSVFIGHYSPESAGDYASGTNHTLPTNGYAHAYSGVSVDSFVRKITFQQLSKEGLRQIGGAVEVMAETEGLRAHAEAVRVRLNAINKES